MEHFDAFLACFASGALPPELLLVQSPVLRGTRLRSTKSLPSTLVGIYGSPDASSFRLKGPTVVEDDDSAVGIWNTGKNELLAGTKGLVQVKSVTVLVDGHASHRVVIDYGLVASFAYEEINRPQSARGAYFPFGCYEVDPKTKIVNARRNAEFLNEAFYNVPGWIRVPTTEPAPPLDWEYRTNTLTAFVRTIEQCAFLTR